MTTRILQPDHENGDGRLNMKYLKRQYDDLPSHRVKTDLSSSVGTETFASGSVKEHQQEVQGRQDSSSSIQRAHFFPSSLSRWDSESTSGNSKSTKTRMRRTLVWGNRRWWWKASSGKRTSGAFWTVLLLIIGATFVCSVYLNHEGLKSRLFDGTSTNSCSRSIKASFPIYYENILLLQQEHEVSEGEQLRLDMTVKIPGC